MGEAIHHADIGISESGERGRDDGAEARDPDTPAKGPAATGAGPGLLEPGTHCSLLQAHLPLDLPPIHGRLHQSCCCRRW